MAALTAPNFFRARAPSPTARPHAEEETRLWWSIGGPIVGLIMLIVVSALILLASVARGQDRAFEVAEAQLVGRALEGIGESVSASAKDFGIWNDAYRNISQRWDEDWVDENVRSSAIDAIVIFRADGTVRHIWTADTFADRADDIAAAVAVGAADPSRLARIAEAPTNDMMVARNYLALGGVLAAVATVPVRPENQTGQVWTTRRHATDYVAAVEIIDGARVEGIKRSLGLRDLAFYAGAEPPPRIAGRPNTIVPNHDDVPIGWLNFQVEQPGSQAFARRAVPIAAGLLLFGVLAFSVSRSLVERQIRVMALARQAAEDASRVKSQFLANMSHELRTPLNAVIGYAELLEEDADASGRPKQADDSRRISSAARHLLGLINDILEHSKFEAARIDLHPEPVAIASLLAEVDDLVRVAAERNNVTLKFACAPDLSACIDRMRVKQCLVNLAGNAVKFTKDGRVSVAARTTSVGGVEMVAIDIVDTGIGICADDLEKLFMPFVQAEGAKHRQFGGTGLGLAITRRLADAMGGAVTVRSTPGAGSTFTLTVPRSAPGPLQAG